jgi:hypothetical protein
MNPYYGDVFPKIKTTKLPLWKRFFLWFMPTYAAVDSPYVTFYKVFRGVVYIVGEEKL